MVTGLGLNSCGESTKKSPLGVAPRGLDFVLIWLALLPHAYGRGDGADTAQPIAASYFMWHAA